MLIINYFITTDDTEQTSIPEKAKPEGKDLSSKWFTCSINRACITFIALMHNGTCNILLSLANEEVLNEDDLVDIIEALDEGGFASSDWYTLGIQLRIKNNDLKTIESDYHDKATRCLNECLIKWLKTGKATYIRLAEALKKMGEGTAADHISSCS